MAKKGLSRRRMLFEAGNTHCPICLTGFKEDDVIRGDQVTIEHAPPKALGGKAICLTCDPCNNTTSKMERLVAEHFRSKEIGEHVTIEFPGCPEQSGRILRGKEGDIKFRADKLRVPEAQFTKALTSPTGSLTLRASAPSKGVWNAPWLKAGYLLLFSWLGPKVGYDYARSTPYSEIRQQILNPEPDVVASTFVFEGKDLLLGGGITLIQQPLPCWCVTVNKERFVVLPNTTDNVLRESLVAAKRLNEGNKVVSFSGQPTWKLGRFAEFPDSTVWFEADIERSLFGTEVSITLEDGRTIRGVCVDHNDGHVSVRVSEYSM